MAFAGQKVLQVWQPIQPLVIKYTLPDFAGFCSVAFCSAGFAAANAPAVSKSSGDAIAAELTSMNFLLVNFELFSVMLAVSPLLNCWLSLLNFIVAYEISCHGWARKISWLIAQIPKKTPAGA